MAEDRQHSDLVGCTFPVRHGRRLVVMEVQKIMPGYAECRSLDLQHVGRWRVEQVRRAVTGQDG